MKRYSYIDIIYILQAFNRRIGIIVSSCVVMLVLLQFGIVLFRYIFGASSIWAQELLQYLHAFVIMGAVSYTLIEDAHVRVDIFYNKMSAKKRALVNFLGSVFLLAPFALVLIMFSFDYVSSSVMLLEGSAETEGIQGVFILKLLIMFFAVSIFLQAIINAVFSWSIAFPKKE